MGHGSHTELGVVSIAGKTTRFSIGVPYENGAAAIGQGKALFLVLLQAVVTSGHEVTF